MISNRFLGERLVKARELRSMTLSQLAEKASVTRQAISQYENENNSPSQNVVANLAKALEVPFEYFFTQSRYQVSSDTAYFRSQMSTRKRDQIAQSRRLEIIAQVYETLLDYIDFPSISLPQINYDLDELSKCNENEQLKIIENIATTVRDSWGLGREPINDLRFTIESHGIITTCAQLNANKIDAFSQLTNVNGYRVYFIVISKDGQTLTRARFDMAHELGHILLHPWDESLDLINHEEFKMRERQANIFAGSLLLPRETFGNDVSLYPSDLNSYIRLKRKWNVSIQAMVYRARQLDILSANQFQYLMQRISQNGWRTHEPGDVNYIPKSTLIQSAVELLLNSGDMTASDFLSILQNNGIILNTNELEDLLCLNRGTLETEKSPQEELIKLRTYNVNK